MKSYQVILNIFKLNKKIILIYHPSIDLIRLIIENQFFINIIEKFYENRSH